MLKAVKNTVMGLAVLSTAACSVIMAANGKGVDPKELAHCKTRTCLLASGAVSVDQVKNKQGKYVSENFRAEMPTGSVARAAMHGLLDVGTLGIWEVVGTPIEASKGKKTGYVIAVKYEADGMTVKHMAFNF